MPVVGGPNSFIAFGAGLLSFFAPCHFPLYPAFISYMTGITTDEMHEGRGRRQALGHTALFILGFSTVFIAMGWSASFIGGFLIRYEDPLRWIAGALIIGLGLVTLGVLRVPTLEQERKVEFSTPAGMAGSFVVGIGFAAGWSPCIGPILASILALSISHAAGAVTYMVLFSLGFAIPFFLLVLFLPQMRWFQEHLETISRIGGAVLVLAGILLVTNRFQIVNVFLTEWLGALG